MNLAFFLVYLGGLFAGSAILFVLVKKFSAHFASTGRKPTVYGVISAVIAAAASFFSTYISENLFSVFWILAGIYLLFGVVHVSLTHTKYFRSRPDNKQQTMMAEMMFAMAVVIFTIVLFSALQYFMKDKSFLFFPMMMSTLTFFIPLLASHTYNAAIGIPPPQFDTWSYPIHQPIDLPDEDPRERLLVIGFEMAKNAQSTGRTYFRAKAPEGMKLGELFYHFINDYNELQSETPITIANELEEPYPWLFRTKPKWYQVSRVLHAGHTIRENQIKENTVIVAERVLEGV
jgi:Type VI secretion system, TssN